MLGKSGVIDMGVQAVALCAAAIGSLHLGHESLQALRVVQGGAGAVPFFDAVLRQHQVGGAARLLQPRGDFARHLAALFNPVLFPGVGEVLRITQQELAYLVGLSRQRVNEALRTLQDQQRIPVAPIHVDSPMALATLEVYRAAARHPEGRVRAGSASEDLLRTRADWLPELRSRLAGLLG